MGRVTPAGRFAPTVAFAFAGLFAVAGASAAPPPIQRHTGPNGLEVLVVENHALPLVTVEIAARNGAMTEPPEYSGLSHLYEHMFFKANAVIPNQEAYLARTHELGMSWNATTGTERVNYFFTTTSDHTSESLAFMRDAIVGPLFDEKELARERVVVTGEMDRAEASPYYHFQRALEQRLWFKYPTRKDPLGTRKTVLAATPEMMRTIQKRYYVPNNSVLVVTGDVKAEEIFAEVDALYGGWKQGEDPFKKFPLVEHPALRASEVVVVEKDVQGYVGQIAWHGPSTVGPSVAMSYPADILGVACGEPSSRFQKALVDSGACVGASVSWYTQKNTGPVSLSFEAAPDKIDACVAAAVAELPRMQSPDYLSETEIANAAHRLEIDAIKEREKPSAFAHTLTFWWASAGLDYYLGYVDNLKKVTGADVAKFVGDYMVGKPFVFASLVSPAMVKGGFDRAHFEGLAGVAPAGAQKGGR